ncbi:MAG TPA: hypothetical protein VNG93_02495 [Candidatus Dormibacteraeota bacterium]|nr:hypothetical protein [Candidatus Dormibacteraeota bacterium]
MLLLRAFRPLRILALSLSILAVGATVPPTIAQPRPVHTQVGFTFVPGNAQWLGFEPAPSLDRLIRRLRPDLVRIPVYWGDVAPDQATLDFTQVDQLLQVISADNSRRHAHQTQVILVVGVRNLSWPEVHLPAWVDTSGGLDLAKITASASYLAYLAGTFRHFAGNPVLNAWQIENEPLDNTNLSLGQVALAGGVVADEVALLKSIDPIHRAVITTYNSASINLDLEASSSFGWLFNILPGPKPAGHPQPTLELADVLGLDVYVDTPSTPLAQASVLERIGWKATTLTYWASEAAKSGKEVWITEMQGAPWNGDPGFNEEDLLESAQVYAGTGVSVILLWGVENWLADPGWMAAGQAAIDDLRT